MHTFDVLFGICLNIVSMKWTYLTLKVLRILETPPPVPPHI